MLDFRNDKSPNLLFLVHSHHLLSFTVSSLSLFREVTNSLFLSYGQTIAGWSLFLVEIYFEEEKNLYIVMTINIFGYKDILIKASTAIKICLTLCHKCI